MNATSPRLTRVPPSALQTEYRDEGAWEGGVFLPTLFELPAREDLSLLPPPASRRAQAPSSRKREDSRTSSAIASDLDLLVCCHAFQGQGLPV